MRQKKTLQEREKELQSLLPTKEGRAELEELASRYGAASGRVRATGTSVVTYILVYEREKGLIAGLILRLRSQESGVRSQPEALFLTPLPCPLPPDP